uniref:Putative BAH domain,TFIIS helical bundle-like domain isoform 1 n=1 Tax=Davidia involucrata TaxID=16924 RepID=A0A5B7BCU0_DAVIN
MHGREGENKKRSRHMWSVPTRGTTTSRTVAGDSTASTADSFCKDGRDIRVGDCALFKPPQDSPPFIGIIRWLTLNKENNLQLGVNWLYRPVEVKLGKGILLDAAPNEVFYSFHKDEIPAASLLHPCKVAFLPKGAELPSGISSFVCRRVYDIANKCLWWLTDQNYIKERQEEVDQLLYKTRIQMHATVQPGGRSPKPINGPTSTSQLKPGSENVQGATYFASQVKGKKRERADQGSEPVKRERSSRADDGDFGQFKPEGILRSEIAKITEKGGLVDSEGVERLVQLMQPNRAERKMELICRSMLAGVIATTDKFDCLSRFVQLRGLLVLDEWLQDVHKGKIGDSSGPKDGDKSVEEFLLVLLRALDKLPVSLHALQMCHIGKSVNHLRSHKNLEIQRKARSLVDTWKKRVEAEMNIIDAKSGSTQAVSWPSRSRIPEVSHGGNRHPGGSSEVVMKSSITQLSAARTASVKPVQGEITAKSATSSPGPMKSVLSPVSGKDGQPRYAAGNTSDIPSTTAKEEKSSSSSQSLNNSQSCSSDHAKTMVFSGKEDARSSGVQRETGSSRSSSLHRNSASEKLSQSGLTCEKAVDVPIVEGNTHKLIVKIPNRGRSPAQSASGGSFEDPSIMNSRASSPVHSEKRDQFDHNLKEKSDAYRANITSDVNTESWQSNDFKDVLTGSDEGDGSPAAIPDEERCGTGDDARKLAEVSKAASTSSGSELKSGKLHEVSFCSINALIESCVKYSEANASMSVGDDVGMNLLASVAAGEMSKSDLVSPTDSPHRNTPIVEDSCMGDDIKEKSSRADNLAQDESHAIDGVDGVIEKQGAIAGTSCSKDGLHHLSKHSLADFSEDNKATSSLSEETPAGERNEQLNFSNMDQSTADPCLETNEKSDEVKGTASATVPHASTTEKVMEGKGSKLLPEKKAIVTCVNVDGTLATKPKGTGSLLTNDKINDVLSRVEVGTQAVEGSSSYPSLEVDGEDKNNVNEGSNSGVHKESAMMHSECVEKTDEEVLRLSGSGKDLTSESVDEFKVGKADGMDDSSHVDRTEKQKVNHEINSTPTIENQVLAGSGSAVSNRKTECMEANVESKEVFESPAFSAQETEQHVRSRGSKLIGADAEECASTTADAASSPAAGASDVDGKPEFDLNEGFIVDDGKYGEPINLSAAVHLINPLPFPVSSVSSGLPASVTVAAAAKGPFVPPEDLLRSKGELGWKGSAATSAFRPAEPRKVLEMPLSTANMPLPDATASKHGRLLLDIDLNVPDERVLEDMAFQNSAQGTACTSDHINNRDLARNDLIGSAPLRGSGGLDLDLNQIDEANDMGQYLTSSSRKLEAPLLSVKSPSSGRFPNCEVRRDFDLNNGPVLDEGGAEPSFNQHGRSSMQFQPPVAGLRLNDAEIRNVSSWLSPGNTYAVTIPSILPDRGDQPCPIVATGGPRRILTPPSGGSPFTPDVYRGSVLSSSPAVPFPSSLFPYPVFPFGSFPLPSATFSGGSTTYLDSSSSGRLCFPAVNSQLLGPAGAVSSQYPRPFVVSLSDGSNNVGGENSRKWGRQGLDLNSGPGGLDVEGRDETLPLALRQLSVASSQALTEEQVRMYQVAGGVLKRKEPEGGWDPESLRYKQSLWQ